MKDMHEGIFKGQVHKRRYRAKDCSYWKVNHPYEYVRSYRIAEYYDFDYEEIAKCEFDRPPLNEGEKVHIHELDEIVTVIESIRSTNGGYIYHTDYIIKEIEDEETEKTKLEAEEILNRWREKNKQKEELNNNDTDDTNNKKWYQFWK